MSELAIFSAFRPSEASQQLEAWAAAAHDGLASATLRAYAADSRAFADWCATQRIATLPSAPETVALFLRAQAAAGKAVATVRRRASTVGRMHRAAGLTNPCDHELVRLALKGIARTRGTDQRQAAGLTERDALTIRARLGDTVRNTRDFALLLVGRDLLTRASELVAITITDIETVEDGLLVILRRKKTTTETQTYFVGAEAAQALQDWLKRAHITHGPVFQSLTRSGKATGRALTTRDVRRLLKELAVGARLGHGMGVSGHSLRVGMAQDLVAADMDIASVMQAGGWTTPRMVARYTQRLTARRGAVARYYGRRH